MTEIFAVLHSFVLQSVPVCLLLHYEDPAQVVEKTYTIAFFLYNSNIYLSINSFRSYIEVPFWLQIYFYK